MNIKSYISQQLNIALEELYTIQLTNFEIQHTKPDFEGDYTLVVFPLVKNLKKAPEVIGNEIGECLKNKGIIVGFNVVKGFLNLIFPDQTFLQGFDINANNSDYGYVSQAQDAKTIMVEFASPNTNKPLHLGHVRNILLGNSVSNICKAAGNKVYTAQVVNDRGIHICKSMLAWQKFGNGETPESTHLKGDHLVGKYYVAFDKVYQQQISELIEQGLEKDAAKKQAPILLEAQEMLIKWEENDPEVRVLWEKMNAWVYEGFNETYKRLGVSFDAIQYESETYLLGKDIVQEGLNLGVFYKKEDGSVWIDLTDEGLDEKLVLRSDGTSVYITQDLGTAIERFKTYHLNQLIYTVGNEQDYHFKVLFLILKKLGYKWADQLYHLSYGMVDLPEGKMKSREGTVVDADDLMQEMYDTAKEISDELGKLDGYTEEEQSKLLEYIGQGALKYYILKVDPKKRILFNPKESVDFAGNTGPFVQYTYARIQSLLRKEKPNNLNLETIKLEFAEKQLIRWLNDFEETIQKAATDLSPALIANYSYDLVKLYNYFYQNFNIFQADDATKIFRLYLSQWTANTLKNALSLLGISAPERM